MNVLVVDDHAMALTAVRSLAEQLGQGVEVVIAPTGQAAKRAIGSGDVFDLVLLDLDVGLEDRFRLLEDLRNTHPALPVVVVADSRCDRACLLRAIEVGAIGFLPRSMTNESLLSSLVVVLSERIRRQSPSRHWSPRYDHSAVAPETRADSATAAIASLELTPRQKDVLELLMRGQSNKLIARSLNVSVETVKDHVTAVLRSLNVASRTQAVAAVSGLAYRSSRPLPRGASPVGL